MLLVEYRKQRMQKKGANRKTFVDPSTINRERYKYREDEKKKPLEK
jgi:hypothetical protein